MHFYSHTYKGSTEQKPDVYSLNARLCYSVSLFLCLHPALYRLCYSVSLFLCLHPALYRLCYSVSQFLCLHPALYRCLMDSLPLTYYRQVDKGAYRKNCSH